MLWGAQHAYSEDGLGPTTRLPPIGQTRNLLYPEGFSATNDGGLKVVRGAHLYRENQLSLDLDPTPHHPTLDPDDAASSHLERDDDAMERWLEDRPHPITGRPLAIERLELPRGSLVACVSHAPHAVDARAPEAGVRYNALLSYAVPDLTGAVPPSVERRAGGKLRLPTEWERLAAAGEVPGVEAGGSSLFSSW